MNPQSSTAAAPEPARPATADSALRRNRSAERALVIAFLAILASGILIQTTVELRRGESLGALEVFRQKPTSANLRAYEHSLEDACVLARALRPWVQFAQFAWLRDGGEKALVGRDGWLFYKPGFDDMISRGAVVNGTNDPVRAIVEFRDALAARGMRLLVVPAPNKESVYPDRLTRRAVPGQVRMSPAMRDLLPRLRSAHVEYLDLFAFFAAARTNTAGPGGSPLYLTQDSHWSPVGLELAARAVAQRLADLGWIGRGTVDFHERPVTVERLGDVLRMMQSPPLERHAAAESVLCHQVVHPETGQPYRDEAQSDVLVLGDSFLRIYQQDEPGAAGFIAHLARELKQPVTSLVSDGGASTLVRQELSRRPALLQHKRVVVWEFVERDLRLGTEGWQVVPLPEASVGSRREEAHANSKFETRNSKLEIAWSLPTSAATQP